MAKKEMVEMFRRLAEQDEKIEQLEREKQLDRAKMVELERKLEELQMAVGQGDETAENADQADAEEEYVEDENPLECVFQGGYFGHTCNSGKDVLLIVEAWWTRRIGLACRHVGFIDVWKGKSFLVCETCLRTCQRNGGLCFHRCKEPCQCEPEIKVVQKNTNRRGVIEH